MTESFTALQELGQESERPCFDPSCAAEGGVGEPEQDGDHRYFTCTLCGNDYGWERVETSVLVEAPDGSCSVGVPESIRRAASGGMEKALADQAKAGPVDLGMSIGKRPGL